MDPDFFFVAEVLKDNYFTIYTPLVSSHNKSRINRSSKDNRFAQSLDHRTEFPALRHAALKCTLQIIEAYREAVGQLMEISPLAEHVDMQEHYIAFVDLKAFGLAPSSSLARS